MKTTFAPSKNFLKKAEKIYTGQKKLILAVLPNAEVHHVGATSIPGSLTKGDIDLNVRIDPQGFNKAIKVFKNIYQINQPQNWNNYFASFKDSKSFDLPLGIQLTVKNSEYDFFVKFREVLIKNPALLIAFNNLKQKYDGKSMPEYRKAKTAFIKDIKDKYLN